MSSPRLEPDTSRAWSDASSPWILHCTRFLGALTERWIDTQALARERFDSRLLGLRAVPGAVRQSHWLEAEDHVLLGLAARAMYRTGGTSMILLARAFRSNRPAVVHTHFGHLSAFHRRFANALDAPLIASFYGFEATERKYTDSAEWRARYGRLFRDSAAILAEGPAMAGRIQALGCAADKIQVIRLPADAAGLADISRGTPDEFVVVGPGRAEEEKKGFDVAVEAFARALKGRAARLELVGGPAAAQLRRRAADLGIESQVTWLGRLPFAEFMTKVARASVAVFPSRRAADGASEGGAPVTLIETQWIGVPVVVSDHDDLPFVSAPQGSVVLPPQDVDAWAEVLRGLYDEPGRLHRMGAAAATFARSNHDPTTNARAREALYEAVQ